MNTGTYFNWLNQNTTTTWWHDSADPGELQLALELGAIGATTNPFLANVALSKNRTAWAPDLDAVLAKDCPIEQKAEELTRKIISRLVPVCLPIYERTNGKAGFVCAQVNPSRAGERDVMMSMARRFHTWAPNIAVKLPATSAGLDVLEDCIAEGITSTATVSFTVSQVIAIAERCRTGRQRASQNGIKPGECFAVIMIGRLDDYLRETARDNCVPVSESDIRQAGIAVTKRAYQIYQERRYEAVLMVAALRGSYHLTELAGANVIMSITPAAQRWFVAEDHPREERIHTEIDPGVIRRLCRMPEFVKAWDPEGMKSADFISYGATQRTLCQYIEAGWRLMEEF